MESMLMLIACLTPINGDRDADIVKDRVQDFIFHHYDKYKEGLLTHRLKKDRVRWE